MSGACATSERPTKKRWRVWTGSSYEETTAVSAGKAINNVYWRVRMTGRFPIRDYFEAEEIKQ